MPMSTKYTTLLESLKQPLPPGFETISGELQQTLLNDLMFRIVFESTPDGLKKLLCALLHMKESEITSITINNPILLGEQIPDKKFILDINLLLNNAKIIHLELQVVSQSYWTNRSLCYLCENFKQLNSGDNYDQLKPLIQIDILDFELYENSEEFYSIYHLANDKTHRIYSDKLAIHVLELNKEEYATEEDKSYGIDYWARLFKSTTWEELKALAMEQTILQSTVEAIYRVNADEQAREAIIDRERFLRDQRTQLDEKKRLVAQIEDQSNTIAKKDAEITELKTGIHSNLKDKISRKIAKGLPLEQIASELEEDLEAIRPIYEELVAES